MLRVLIAEDEDMIRKGLVYTDVYKRQGEESKEAADTTAADTAAADTTAAEKTASDKTYIINTDTTFAPFRCV